MTDIDQQRANTALKKVQDLQGKGYNYYGNYVSFVKALPATILQIGLGQAIATELAASGNENETQKGHKQLFESINEWLGRDDDIAPYPRTHRKREGVLPELMASKQEKFIYAQQEALAYLDWLKKFAVALLDTEQTS